MSLFDTLKDTTNGYASALNAGSYTFEKPADPEPAPSVSLYNLLDHSEADIDIAIKAFQYYEAFMLRDGKMKYPKAYPTTIAWIRIFQQAKSEAWAEKTAKEINETTKL
jgi:hypothetical protein